MFRANVEDSVLMHSKLKNTMFGAREIKRFFEQNEPDKVKFESSHVRIAEYLLQESRRQMQTSSEKTYILQTYPKSMIVEHCMTLLNKYNVEEIISLFKEWNLKNQTQLPPDFTPHDKLDFMYSMEMALEEQRKDRPSLQINYVKKPVGRKKPNDNKCFHCKKPGHKKADCPSWKGSNKSVSNKKLENYLAIVKFIYDSGSDAHVVNDMSYFHNFCEKQTAFETVNGQHDPVFSLGYG
ncbi:hypothetical protein OXX79_012654, partial [Metschnikowia pulcherrima]